MSEEITVSDIEAKIQEKMDQYEDSRRMSERIRLDELNKLISWISCGDDY